MKPQQSCGSRLMQRVYEGLASWQAKILPWHKPSQNVDRSRRRHSRGIASASGRVDAKVVQNAVQAISAVPYVRALNVSP
jgi:hypothetical protein